MRGRLAAALLLMLSACAANKKAEAPPPAAAQPQLDASYDWHVLVLAPFGTVVKQVPFKLHEVLLFKDQESSGADAGECYAPEQAPPIFLKHTPSEFLLCFKHDHLWRIEAVVMVAQDEVREVLTSACGLWHQKAGDSSPWVAPPCSGGDGTVHYDAHLEEDAAEDGAVPLNVKLEQVAPPES
jgi:hypothetical protein